MDDKEKDMIRITTTRRRPLGAALAAALGAVLAAAAFAQETRQVVVPLSDPNGPVTLHADLLNGSISVTGYEGTEVLIETTIDAEEDEGEEHAGLRRIPNTSVGLTVEERANTVSIESDWSARSTHLIIKVPRRTSVHLATVNDGDLEVTGVTGDHELENVNGAITATDVSGSVVANTTNGDVRVRFRSLTADKPMSFSTWNGDVDLTLPADARAHLLMNSGQGDIYTDFDVALSPQDVKMSREEGQRGFRVRLEKEVGGSINGGGAEFRFKTYNGDIYVRKGGA
jgi:hypothetical protein